MTAENRNAAWRRYKVETEVMVEIEVRNSDAIERVTGLGGDEWRSQFYRLHTVDDVLEHWTYNALINGVLDVSRLEGWADLASEDVVINLEHADLLIAQVIS